MCVIFIHMCALRNVTAVPYSVHIIVIVNRKDAVKELNCYTAVNALVCRLSFVVCCQSSPSDELLFAWRLELGSGRNLVKPC